MEVWPAEAIDAGLVSVEHIATIFEGKVAGSLTDPRDQLRAIQEYASGGVDTLAKHFVEHNAWFNPTLVAYGVNSRLAELEETPDPRRRYLSPRLEAHWDENFPIAPYELNPRVVAFRKQGDTAFAAVVGKLHQNGVGLLTGTDLGTREIYPGFSVHDELILLVERAGLPPLEALRAATRNPARYLDADSLGVIAAGTLADFVVLEANPLENIRNTSRIRAVAVDGRYYSRDALDSLLLGTERQVADPAVP